MVMVANEFSTPIEAIINYENGLNSMENNTPDNIVGPVSRPMMVEDTKCNIPNNGTHVNIPNGEGYNNIQRTQKNSLSSFIYSINFKDISSTVLIITILFIFFSSSGPRELITKINFLGNKTTNYNLLSSALIGIISSILFILIKMYLNYYSN